MSWQHGDYASRYAWRRQWRYTGWAEELALETRVWTGHTHVEETNRATSAFRQCRPDICLGESPGKRALNPLQLLDYRYYTVASCSSQRFTLVYFRAYFKKKFKDTQALPVQKRQPVGVWGCTRSRQRPQSGRQGRHALKLNAFWEFDGKCADIVHDSYFSIFSFKTINQLSNICCCTSFFLCTEL